MARKPPRWLSLAAAALAAAGTASTVYQAAAESPRALMGDAPRSVLDRIANEYKAML